MTTTELRLELRKRAVLDALDVPDFALDEAVREVIFHHRQRPPRLGV